MDYRIKLKLDDNGTYLVSVPDFPEVHTFGDTEEEALAHAVDAIETALVARMDSRQDIVLPSKAKRPAGRMGALRGERIVTLPTLSVSKIALYRAMKAEKVTQAELARRLKWHPPQVARLLDLRHASRHDQLDAAFRKLGKRLTVSVQDAA